MKNVIDGFVKSPALMYFSGIWMIILGMLVVLSHNIWGGGLLPVLITFMGWATLVKGAVWLIMPSVKVKIMKWVDCTAYFVIAAIIVLAIGIYTGYMGFFGA